MGRKECAGIFNYKIEKLFFIIGTIQKSFDKWQNQVRK